MSPEMGDRAHIYAGIPQSSFGPRFKPTRFEPSLFKGAQREVFLAARQRGRGPRVWLAKALLLLSLGCFPCLPGVTGSLSHEKLQQYRGKIVVLNFWAAWCKPCKKEMAVLAELHRQFEARGVQFVGACTDDAKDREKAESLVRANEVSYPIWFDLSDEEMKRLALGSSIPATAIFDREGNRMFRLIGEVKKKQLIERLEWLLGNQKGRSPKELVLPALIDRSEYGE